MAAPKASPGARLALSLETYSMLALYSCRNFSLQTYHHISRMRDNSAENTSKITTCERNSSLGTLSIIRLLTGKTVIDHFHDRLERGELHHSVRNLTPPKRIQSLVKSTKAFLGCDRADSVKGTFCKRGDCSLHPDFDG